MTSIPSLIRLPPHLSISPLTPLHFTSSQSPLHLHIYTPPPSTALPTASCGQASHHPGFDLIIFPGIPPLRNITCLPSNTTGGPYNTCQIFARGRKVLGQHTSANRLPSNICRNLSLLPALPNTRWWSCPTNFTYTDFTVSGPCTVQQSCNCGLLLAPSSHLFSLPNFSN